MATLEVRYSQTAYFKRIVSAFFYQSINYLIFILNDFALSLLFVLMKLKNNADGQVETLAFLLLVSYREFWHVWYLRRGNKHIAKKITVSFFVFPWTTA